MWGIKKRVKWRREKRSACTQGGVKKSWIQCIMRNGKRRGEDGLG